MLNNVKVFTRRVFILGAIKLFLLFTLVIRLFYLQIRENNYFEDLSNKNKTSYIPIIPKRGIIYDRFKTPLASNVLVWQAAFIKSKLNQKIEVFLDSLHSIISISDDEKNKIITTYKTASSYSTIVIKTNLSNKDIASIETFHNLYPIIFINGVYKRTYPFGAVVAHTLGYVGATDNVSNKNTPSWFLGKNGIELSFDSILKGDLGYQKYEINAKGKVVNTLGVIEPFNGQNITLTIDINLQQAIYDLIKNLSAAAVVMNIETGEVLSMVSAPSFDPNAIINGISQKDWNALIKNPEHPLNNRTLKGLYAPASTMKPFMALLALEKGIITPTTKLECPGYFYIGNRKFHCWRKQGHGFINVEQSIVHSCDVFYYKLGIQLSRKDIRDLGVSLQFDQDLLPIMPGNHKGNIPLSDPRPPLGDLAVTAIGQGEWLATVLHIANMAAIIGNKGKSTELKILREMEYKNKIIYSKMSQVTSYLPFSLKYINLVQNALYNVINFDYGVGHNADTNDPNWPMSGKTGTAQVVSITEEQRKAGLTQAKLRKFRDHAIFMGYMPSYAPKYAIGLAHEHAGFSAAAAAPIAGKIANLVKQRHTLYEQQEQELEEILNNAQNS
ncbi:penicillin-binding protein 2 [Rickettsiales bacterium LUAb2]